MVDGIVVKQALEAGERAAVERLAARSNELEAIDLPITDGPDMLHVLCYRAGELLAAASVWLIEEAEIQGAVHPGHRRQGLGRAVLAAAQAAAQRHGTRGCLLVCDEAGASGPAFARAVGAEHRFSEYQMVLDARPAGASAGAGPLHIRQATSGDAAALVRIVNAAFGRPEDDAQARVARSFADPDKRYFLGLLGGELVGCLRLVPEAGAVYITSFGVLPEHQGHGYGRQLLQWTIALLQSEGWPDIRIEVQTTNQAGLSLYTACGFRTRRTYGYYGLPST